MVRSSSARALLLAAAFALSISPVAAKEKKREPADKGAAAAEMKPDECALRYAASLKRIAADSLPKIGSAPGSPTTSATTGDASLPGTLLFVAPSRPRTQAEISALTAATALARSKGRSTGVVDADRIWIAARLREDLADYLGQKPTPYLCSGVDPYLQTLRSFARRLGPTVDRRQVWIATQRAAAARSVAAVGEAVAKARSADASAASAAPIAKDLRTGDGAERGEPALGAVAGGVALATSDDIAAVAERLVQDVTEAGFVAEPIDPAATGGPTASEAHPALTRLQAVRPYVMAGRPLVTDRSVRLRMVAAFADLEALDYLLQAEAVEPDPVASAIDGTIGAIETAHRADCTCGR